MVNDKFVGDVVFLEALKRDQKVSRVCISINSVEWGFGCDAEVGKVGLWNNRNVVRYFCEVYTYHIIIIKYLKAERNHLLLQRKTLLKLQLYWAVFFQNYGLV